MVGFLSRESVAMKKDSALTRRERRRKKKTNKKNTHLPPSVPFSFS